jgi:carbon-monoxide dehydrogenase small subunit
VTACLVLALDVEGREVTTIEGLAARWHAQSGARPPALHPVQQGFLEEGGAQCGFCTAGMIMAAAGLLEASPTPSEAEIRAGLEGNLCRCTGYVKIIRAVEVAAERMRARREMPA